MYLISVRVCLKNKNLISLLNVKSKKKKKTLSATVAEPPTEQTTRSRIHFPLWLESSLVVMQGLLLLHTVSKLRLSTLESNSEKQKGEDDDNADK